MATLEDLTGWQQDEFFIAEQGSEEGDQTFNIFPGAVRLYCKEGRRILGR